MLMQRISIPFLVGLVFGQNFQPPTGPSTQTPRGTLVGKVQLEGSGQPLEDVQIQVTPPQGQTLNTFTNPDGVYQLRNALPPGRYRVRAARRDNRGTLGAPLQKYVMVTANSETTADFTMPPLAEMSGRILDANKEPVPNVRVTLIHVMYGAGERVYIDTHMSTSANDVGEYSISGIEPGHPFLIYVEAPQGGVQPASAGMPADPALRRPLRASTFYPSSLIPEAAQSVQLGKGEVRTGVNIEMIRTPSYCVEGAIPADPGFAPSSVTVDTNMPASGGYSDTLHFRPGKRFLIDPTGKIRVCGLAPGDYHMFVQPANALPNGVVPSTGAREFYGAARFTITDRDLPPIAIEEQPVVDVPVEVAWDGPAPAESPGQSFNFAFGPAGGSATNGRSVTSKLPGTAVMEKLRKDVFVFFVRNVPNGAYVKDITYGGQPIPRPFIPGSAPGEKPGIKVTLARDGGSVTARVEDKDGPVPGYPVLLIPETVASPADISNSVATCFTEADGACRRWNIGQSLAASVTQVFPPGKYYMIATQLSFSPPADEIDKLWRSLSKATEVNLAPGSMVETVVAPVSIQ